MKHGDEPTVVRRSNALTDERRPLIALDDQSAASGAITTHADRPGRYRIQGGIVGPFSMMAGIG